MGGGGAVLCGSSDLNSGKKVRVFHFRWGGVLCKLRSELRKESFSFSGGVFCVSSDLNSGKKVRVFHSWGGVLCKARLGLWEKF